ncbi:MAG: AAA family ATPase [Clostridia bacterium]|nr:AAA family ATPase [Clostridia bacterium]
MSPRMRIIRNILALAFMIFISFNLTPTPKQYDPISYSEFMRMINEEDISEISYSDSEKYAIVHQISTDEYYKVGIVSAENFQADVYTYSLNKADFNYSNTVPVTRIDPFASFLVYLMVYSFFIFVWNRIYFWIAKKRGKNPGKADDKSKNKSSFSFGALKSPLNSYTPRKVDKVDIKFSDVIGLDKQIDEFQDIVRFLKEPQKYEDIGASLPKGILIYGKPGVGKTHIAKAIAGEANVPFYEISASELQSIYVGGAEEKIRNLFDEAIKHTPAIIFIDELDSIAVKRYSDNSNRYAASIVNQLLACMDGFEKNTGIIVIAATNHIDKLDDAILRSGRFDRKIYIHEPDKESRRKLIEYYSADKVMAQEVDIGRLIDLTYGLTGADIKTILNEAAILAVRHGLTAIDEDTIMEAFRKVEIGTENNITPSSKEKLRKTAIHEAGHAIVTKHFGQDVSEISIIARGNAAGYNLAAPDEESDYSFSELKHRVMCLLAGRAAEELTYKEPSAGASDDLRRASSIIRDMFYRFSMRDDQNISLVYTEDSQFNEMVARESYTTMTDFFKKCYKETMEIIKAKQTLLTRLSDELLDKETLSKIQIEAILKDDNYHLKSE